MLPWRRRLDGADAADATEPEAAADGLLAELGFSSDEASGVLRMGRECADREDWVQAAEAVRRAREADVDDACVVEIQLLAIRVRLASGDAGGAAREIDLLCESADASDPSWIYRAMRTLEETKGTPPRTRARLIARLRLAAPAVVADPAPRINTMRLPSLIVPAHDGAESSTVADLPAAPALEPHVEENPMQVGALPGFGDDDATSGSDDVVMEVTALPALDEEEVVVGLAAAANATSEPVLAGKREAMAGGPEYVRSGHRDAARAPVIDADPFEQPEVYVRPHVHSDVPAAPSIAPPPHVEAVTARRSGDGLAAGKKAGPRALYAASAEVRRQRQVASATDAQRLLKEFVRSQIGAAHEVKGPMQRDEAESLFDLGMTFLQMEQYESAKQLFDQAMQHPDFQIPATEGLLEAMVMGGEGEGAMMMGRLALQAFSRNGMSLIGVGYWFARAAEAEGSVSVAREAYDSVVREDSGYEDASTRLAALG